MSSPLKVLIGRVRGSFFAGEVATNLIYSCRWFELQPLPDGCYEFTVKDEAGARSDLKGCDTITKGTR